MRIRSIFTAGVVATALITTSVSGQRQSDKEFWGSTWFWGAQAGTFVYKAGGTTNFGFATGGHWFITSGRTAFNLAFDQVFLPTTNVTVGSNAASFGSGQRLSATVYAMPSTGNLQIFLGGGFSINNMTDAAPTGPFATAAAQTAAIASVTQVATKAFAILGGGVQLRVMDKWVGFGQYHFMPGTSDFVITSPQHLLQGGLRFALTGAKEVVTTER